MSMIILQRVHHLKLSWIKLKFVISKIRAPWLWCQMQAIKSIKKGVNLLIVRKFFKTILSYLIQCNLTGTMMFVLEINHRYKIYIQPKKRKRVKITHNILSWFPTNYRQSSPQGWPWDFHYLMDLCVWY